MQLLKLSQTAEPMLFVMIDSSDHLSGKTGLSPTVKISKNGASGVTPSGAISEVDSTNNPGLYKIAGNATDCGTVGPVMIHASATGADQSDTLVQIVGYDPESASVVASSVTGAVGSVTGAVGSVTGNVGGNVVGSTGSVVGAVGSVTGAVGSVTGAVGSVTGNVGGNVVGSVGSVIAAVVLAANDSPVVHTGTAQAGAATTITLAAGASATDQIYRGQLIKTVSGTGAGQARIITGYIGSTKVVTINRAWAITPDNTTVYAVLTWDGPKTDTSMQVTAALQAVESLSLQSGTAQAGGASTITLASVASATDSLYVGCQIKVYGGTGSGQARIITAYVGATKVATVDRAWITAPDSTSSYNVMPLSGPMLNAALQTTALLTTLDSPAVQTGTAQAGGATSITLASAASASDTVYVGENVLIIAGTGIGQTRTITAYVGSTKVATVSRGWNVNPDTTSVYVVLSGQSPNLNASLQVALQLGHGETLRLGTAQAGGASTITLDAGSSATDNLYQGAQILITSGTGLGQPARSIASYVGSTKVATITPNWITNPDSTTSFAIIGLPIPKIDSSQQVVAASVTGAVGSVTGAVGSVTGAVGSVTGAVTVGTNSDKTGYGLAADQAVNVTKVAGTTQTARDLGASVLISPGTGTGQLDVTSGVVKANLAQILGTALSETAGQIAAAFKKFYDIASPTSTANVITTVGAVTGAVGSVTAPVTAGTVSDKTGYALAVAPPTAAQVAAAVLLTPANLIATNASNQVVASGVQGSVTGSVGSVTGAVGSVTGAVGSVTADVGITQIGADKVWSTAVRKLSVEGVQAIWDALTSSLTTIGSIGKWVLDNLDTNVGSRGTGDATVANQTTINTNVLSRLAGVSYTAPPSVGAIDTQLTGTHGAGLWQQGSTVAPDNAGIAAIKAKTDNLPADPASNTEVDTRLATTGYMAPPSPASVTAAIWGDSANYADGSKGAELATSNTAHDPWATDLPGGYTNPQAGYIIGTRLDVAVGSRAIAGSVTQTAPYSASGLIRLHVGADYGPSPGHLPRVLWTVGPGVAPDATDGTFVVSIPGLVGSPFVGHIVIASPSDVQLFEGLFTHTQTAGWITGTHHFRALLTTAGGAQIIIAEGLIEVGPGA